MSTKISISESPDCGTSAIQRTYTHTFGLANANPYTGDARLNVEKAVIAASSCRVFHAASPQMVVRICRHVPRAVRAVSKPRDMATDNMLQAALVIVGLYISLIARSLEGTAVPGTNGIVSDLRHRSVR